MSSKKDKIIELHRKGLNIFDISIEAHTNERYVKKTLTKAGLWVCDTKYARMDTETAIMVIALNEKKLNATQIAKETGLTDSGVKAFLKRTGLKQSYTPSRDLTRPCIVCKKPFTPKSRDGLVIKFKTCSKTCLTKHKIAVKTGYSSEDVLRVIALKSKNKMNQDICVLTGLNINTVKAIIRKNNSYLTPEQRQLNAYASKIKKDPFCMVKMRAEHMELSQEQYEYQISLVEQAVRDGKGTVSGLARRFNLNPASVVENLKSNGKGYLLKIKDSTPERDLEAFLKSHIQDGVKCNKRDVITPYELDLHVPSLKFAIEYCGLYYHSEIFKKDPKYHIRKLKMCRALGIRLITIFEDEWVERPEQVKNFILSVIGKNPVSLYGRKTVIFEPIPQEASLFLDSNHIQGDTQYKKCFGLSYDGELVGLITGNRHHRQGNSDVLVLNRLAFKSGVTVVGGASKLMKSLIKFAKESGYKKIISWSDNRYSEGGIYKKLGFALSEELREDYSYVTQQIRLSKQSCTKDKLLARGAVGTTEREMALSLKLHRIWDCGKKRWEYDLT